MGYTKKRVDKNQSKVVKELRENGFSVALTHIIGNGFPDFVVGFCGFNILVELKSENGKLTTDETEFHNNYDGHVIIAFSTQDVIEGVLDYIKRCNNGTPNVINKLKEIRDNNVITK